ncbi:hypothetical protein GCM10011375_40990 [Hymenobacter qilianensis]|nr:hypothetical protein GCM10011375_40990 [Hymenobacter qilianensis]
MNRWRWLSLLLVVPFACKKPEPEPEAMPLPTELKAYTLFEPGTYWIYQDSASRQLDSVWVTHREAFVTRRWDQQYNRVNEKYENFRLLTQSSRGGPERVYSVFRTCGLSIPEDASISGYPCWTIRRGLSLPNSTADEGSTTVFPYRIARDQAPVGYLFGELKSYWHTAPVPIGNTTYADVLEVNIPLSDRSEYGWPSHYYWAPHVGIVRQRTWYNDQPQTWTLVRSHIVQ